MTSDKGLQEIVCRQLREGYRGFTDALELEPEDELPERRVGIIPGAADHAKSIPVADLSSLRQSCAACRAKKGLVQGNRRKARGTDNALFQWDFAGNARAGKEDLTEKFREIHGIIEKWNEESGIVNNE